MIFEFIELEFHGKILKIFYGSSTIKNFQNFSEYIFLKNSRARLVAYFEQPFEYFKHTYTLFYKLFHSHVYQKHSNNIYIYFFFINKNTQTILFKLLYQTHLSFWSSSFKTKKGDTFQHIFKTTVYC